MYGAHCLEALNLVSSNPIRGVLFLSHSHASGKLPWLKGNSSWTGPFSTSTMAGRLITNYYVFASWAIIVPGISQWAVGSCFRGLNFTSPLLVLFVSNDSSPMKCWLSHWPTYQLFGIIFTRHKHFKLYFMVRNGWESIGISGNPHKQPVFMWFFVPWKIHQKSIGSDPQGLKKMQLDKVASESQPKVRWKRCRKFQQKLWVDDELYIFIYTHI